MGLNKSAFLIITIFVLFILSIKLFGIIITGNPVENVASKLIIGADGDNDNGNGDSGNGNGDNDANGIVVIKPQCDDKKDNDKDNLIDFPSDPGCVNYKDNNETDGKPTALFNISIKVHPDKKNVNPGDKVLADVQIINFGDLRPVDIFLKCNMEKSEGEVLTYYAEYLALDTQLSIVRTLNVPINASGGQYSFICFLIYNDQQIHSSDMFNVISEEEPGFLKFDYSLILFFILMILIIIRVLSFILKQKKKAKLAKNRIRIKRKARRLR